MGYGIKLENLQSSAELSQFFKKQNITGSNKDISVELKKAGITVDGGNITMETELFLQQKSISVSNKSKDFSLIGEQSKEDKINNPNIQNEKKKRKNISTLSSFSNDEDPFYEVGLQKPLIEDIEKVNKDRETTFKKSIPIANYLATIGKVK